MPIGATGRWWIAAALAAPQAEEEPEEPHGAEFASIVESMRAALEPRLLDPDFEESRAAMREVAALRLAEARPQLVALVDRLAPPSVEAFDLAQRFEARFEPPLLARLRESPRFRSRKAEVERELARDARGNGELLDRILHERLASDGWREAALERSLGAYLLGVDSGWLLERLLPIARSRIVLRGTGSDCWSGRATPLEELPTALLATACVADFARRRPDVVLSRPVLVAAEGVDAAQLEKAIAAVRSRHVEGWRELGEALADDLLIDRAWLRTPPPEERVEVVDERGAPAPPEPLLSLAPFLPFPRLKAPVVGDPSLRAWRERCVALAREELESEEWRIAAWGAAHAADRGLAELAPELERLIARAGRAVAALPEEPAPNDAAFTGHAPLAAGWAALDAALMVGAVIAPDAVEPWWSERLDARGAALLLATRAPDRFAAALLAREQERWTPDEWRLWCATIARCGRADATARLLDRIALPIEVHVHGGSRCRPDWRPTGSWGCGIWTVAIPAGFPTTRQWAVRRGGSGRERTLPVALSELGADRRIEWRSPKYDHPRGVPYQLVDSRVEFDRCHGAVRALGADLARVRGDGRRDLEFVDMASYRATRAAMEQADVAWWRQLLDGLVAAGRLDAADIGRWPPPFRYDYRVCCSGRTLPELADRR